MNVAKGLFKNTIALTIASAGQLIGNIVLFFYLSRLLEPEGLGIYSTVLAVFQTASLGCGIGLNTLLPREIPRNFSQTNRYLIHASIISVISAIIVIIVIAILIPNLNYLPETKLGLYIILFALIPESIQVVLFAIFISYQKAEFISATSIFIIFGRIITCLTALHLGYGVISLIIIYALFSYLSFFININLLIRYIQKPYWDFDRSFLFELLHALKIFAGLSILNALFSQSEVVILSLLRGETQVGYYSAALKLVTIWAMVPNSYMTALFPLLSTTFLHSPQKTTHIQNISIKYLLALAFPLAVGITITASAIIPLLYGDKFDESIGILRLLAWYLPLIFCNTVLWRVLVVRGEQRLVFRVQFITEIIQVLLALGLIPNLGTIGAAFAVIGGNLAYTLLSIYYIQRDKTPLPLFNIGWRFIIASMFMGFFTWFLMPRLHIYFLIPAAAILYLAILFAMRAFSGDDISLFKQIFGLQRKNEPLS